MNEQAMWLKEQNVWVRKENGVIAEKEDYINSLQALSGDKSKSTKRCFKYYINKYKYLHYHDVSCKRYEKYWLIPSGILEKTKAMLVIFRLNKSAQARKMSDYICRYMYAIEERWGIDVKCFGDVDKIANPRNKLPSIRLIYLGDQSFRPETEKKNIFEPIYCCPKCKNKRDFIVSWKADCRHYVKCIKDKKGRYVEKKINFDARPIGKIFLICQKCGCLIKSDPVINKKGDAFYG